MALPRLIVCETTSKWVVALRRQLPQEFGAQICETRSLHDCWQQAACSPSGLVVLEVTTVNLEQLAVELQKYRAEVPRVPVVVVGSRSLAAVEWLMRELGAVHVVFSVRAMSPLVRIIQRHWDRIAAEEPADGGIPWRQLPWEANAVETGSDENGQIGQGGIRSTEPDWLVGDGP